MTAPHETDFAGVHKEIDVFAEAFTATKQVRHAHFDHMLSLGVTNDAMARLGADRPPFGIARIRPLEDGLYAPASDGVPALIVPVTRVIEADWLGIDMSHPEIIDLIALRTSQPERWLWRIGTGWALGIDNLGADRPLEVVATPIEWIASAGRALCILDWAAPVWCWELVRSELQLILQNDRLRQRLRNALALFAVMPDMEISHAA